MVVRLANNYRIRANGKNPNKISYAEVLESKNILPARAKLLAWGIFLIFFIENGTLGLIPRNYYFVYRNMRISDFLIYGLTIYSLFNTREFAELYRSRPLILIKAILIFFFAQFIISSILYQQNFFEYFFRLKGVWSSLLIFPYLLLLKRKALSYLIKIMLPVTIVANILYILSSVTGVALMPDIGVEKANLPGGFQVYRVFGGTFFGEFFFLAFVFQWITDKFRLYQLPLALLFITPHILAFGRSAWVNFSFSILLMFIWNFMKNREFKLVLRQAIILVSLILVTVYVFMRFIPQSDYLTDAISARIVQGQEDVEYKTGTFGTRLANIDALLGLWQSSNIFFGVGMHPMWVIRAETVEENIYAWGFSDVRWASVLAAYGLVGFILALIFQITYGFYAGKVLITTRSKSILTFFTLMLFSNFLFDTFINYSYNLISMGLWGFPSMLCFYISVTVYKMVYTDA